MPATTITEFFDLDLAIGLAHGVAGWLLIVFAFLIIATAGPRRRARAVAVLFAAAIVLTVLSGCSGDSSTAPPESSVNLLPVVVGLGLLGLGVGTTMAVVAVRLLHAAVEAIGQAVSMLIRGAALVGGSIAAVMALGMLW
ncbi:hypothetical protein [Cryptosporangium minutisporangium]|uniref:Uncharacterized protein n=1 Tax=Cryptosporangium minutisporangium TaxID=113569 RepID=A0ABP6SWH2_9ACTN